MNETNTTPYSEVEIDGCPHKADEADATPDEDLPAAVGGVE